MQGGAKTGTGLAVDCVRPIVEGTAQRPKASKALPQVDQQIVAACKASNPNFGKGNPQRAGKTEQNTPVGAVTSTATGRMLQPAAEKLL